MVAGLILAGINGGAGNAMRKIAVMAGLAIAATIVASAGWAFAQQASTILPEVVVTAPTAAPPTVYTPMPAMLGKVRVDEDKWPEIPCSGAHIAAPAPAGKC